MAFFLSLHPTALRKTKGEDYVCEHHEVDDPSCIVLSVFAVLSDRGRGDAKHSDVDSEIAPHLQTVKKVTGKLPQLVPQIRFLLRSDAEPDNSLWTCAYQDLARNDPKLIQKLNECLKINLSENGIGDPECSEINMIVHDAIEEIASTEKAKHHGKVASAAQQCSDKAIPIILASKDLI
ncbi:MAG: hypothetical protein Q9194_005743 [Teloschistes cf. exilis]